MSESFNSEQYSEKWEGIIIPLMSAIIVLSLIAAYGLQFTVGFEDGCKVSHYVYCGEYESPGYSHH